MSVSLMTTLPFSFANLTIPNHQVLSFPFIFHNLHCISSALQLNVHKVYNVIHRYRANKPPLVSAAEQNYDRNKITEHRKSCSHVMTLLLISADRMQSQNICHLRLVRKDEG